jgi:hypothetical protein
MRKLISPALLLAFVGSGCGGGAPSPSAPAFTPKDQTTCKVRKSQSNPLIVEWPSADRASLETRSRQGLVVVRYDGCELELLTRCHAPGSYRYTSVSPKKDSLRIRNEDELWASMPIGAASLEGKLRNGGELGVNMTLVGTYQSDRVAVAKTELEGLCDGATHILGGLSVGAFEFFSAAADSRAAGASVAGVGASATSSSSQEVLATDGRSEACNASSSKDTEPPDGCAALLRIEVIPLEGGSETARGESPRTAGDNPAAIPAPATATAANPAPAAPLTTPNATVRRYLDAANAGNTSAQQQLASPDCWTGECESFARQAGRKFRVALSGPVRTKAFRAVAGVSVLCPSDSFGSTPRSERKVDRGPWMGFPAAPLGGMKAAPAQPSECDSVYLYLEHGEQGWKVAWIDEDDDHADKYLTGLEPAKKP